MVVMRFPEKVIYFLTAIATIALALLEFFVIAEDLGKGAFDEIAQTGNYHHVEASARLEVLVDILEEEIVVFVVGFCRQVGDRQRK